MTRPVEIQQIRDMLSEIHILLWPRNKEPEKMSREAHEAIAQIWKVRDEIEILERKMEKAKV